MADEASKQPGPFDVQDHQASRRADEPARPQRDRPARRRRAHPLAARPACRRPPSGRTAAAATAAPAPVTPAEPQPAAAEKPGPHPGRDQEPHAGHLLRPGEARAPSLTSSVGSRVTPTTVVCLIEAMKIFNEITGRLHRRHHRDPGREPAGGRVSDQVLFRVDPSRRVTDMPTEVNPATVVPVTSSCSSASWWPTAVRSPCGSSAPARTWASRWWPSYSEADRDAPYLEPGRRGHLHRAGRRPPKAI